MEAAFRASLTPEQLVMYTALLEERGASLQSASIKSDPVRAVPIHAAPAAPAQEELESRQLNTAPITALASAAAIAAIRLNRQSSPLCRDSPEVDALKANCFARQQREMARKGGEVEELRRERHDSAGGTLAHLPVHACGGHLGKYPTLPLAAIKRLMRHDSGASVQMVTADAVDVMEVVVELVIDLVTTLAFQISMAHDKRQTVTLKDLHSAVM